MHQHYNQMRSPPKLCYNGQLQSSGSIGPKLASSSKDEDSEQSQIKTLKVSSENINRAIEIFSWRFKTSLPIIKPIHFAIKHSTNSQTESRSTYGQILHNNNNKKQQYSQISGPEMTQFLLQNPHLSSYELLVKLENIRCRLSQISLLPFPQIIYLLKEMLIGYDVLRDIFGTIEPSDQMVAVNQDNQWVVWICEDYYSFSKDNRQQSMGQRQFIYKLIVIGESHCTCSSLSKIFFMDMKEFTYSKECTFIRTLEKIKEFVKYNKVFQVNKVSITYDRIIHRQSEKIINSSEAGKTIRSNYTGPISNKKIQPKHKMSGFYQSDHSNSELRQQSSFNKSQFITSSQPMHAYNSNPSQHLSQNNSNNIFSAFRPNSVAGNLNRTGYNSSKFLSIQTHPNVSQFLPDNQFTNLFSGQEQTGSAVVRSNRQKIGNNGFKSSINFPLHQSPQRMGKIQFGSIPKGTRGRHQIKQMVNSNMDSGEIEPKKPKDKKNIRKYSEQLMKVKSMDLLISKGKKIYGSNIYDNDPEIRLNGVNIIKRVTSNAPSKGPQTIEQYVGNNNNQVKCISSPNNSNSTKELQNSRETDKGSFEAKYRSLKMNDLNLDKFRNNQSSYYGMGGVVLAQPERKDKNNMAVSYQFRNRNQFKSVSPCSREQANSNMAKNNWNTKLSGLFSDNASIKNLKGSVKFRTAEDEIYEKEYLKDVKLDLLQKFGRQVRHSIVDEEDEELTPRQDNHISKNQQYKSMQLIEEAYDDQAKSHVDKEDHHDQSEPIRVRPRHQTMQSPTFPAKTRQTHNDQAVNMNKKQCLSEYYSSSQEEIPTEVQQLGFNFEVHMRPATSKEE